MSDQSQRTEKPTPQRLKKAREQGQFPSAREFVGAVQLAVVVAMITAWSGGWLQAAQRGFRQSLTLAFQPEISQTQWILLFRAVLAGAFLPLATAAGVVFCSTLLMQIAATNMGVSLGKLMPKFDRLNPVSKLRSIPRENLPAGVQAALVLLFAAYVVYTVTMEALPVLLTLPLTSVQTGIMQVSAAASSVLWRTTGILIAIAAIELLRQRRRHSKDLAMTKQEIREEMKENEGDPHQKGQIRRLRRDLLRRQMMREIPTATAVVVNPTHYAIAIRYDATAMASPKVVAKGRNYLALRIKAIAIEHGVPVMENPPLARALYGAVEIGREIPPDFYRAIAEILAYVYRTLGRRQVTT